MKARVIGAPTLIKKPQISPDMKTPNNMLNLSKSMPRLHPVESTKPITFKNPVSLRASMDNFHKPKKSFSNVAVPSIISKNT